MHEDERQALLRRAYAHFNRREVHELLALMTDDVEWPDVANGVVLHDKADIERYWRAQFAVADPRVEPVDFLAVDDDDDADDDGGVVAVVDQRILDHGGALLGAPTIVYHRYEFRGDLVRRMRVFAARAEALS